MKKHTLEEHYQDVLQFRSEKDGMWVLDWKSEQQISWFTAYERWLNDRVLLTEEDARPQTFQASS